MKQTIVTRHKVKNIDTWLKGHQDRVRIFAPALSSFRTFQDTDNPNSVVMVLEDVDLELFTKILNDPSTQKFKDKHTVLEPIVLSMQVNPK
ncbi:hypothetical protein [Yeosuana sp.]|uniref:hypothetical protein n=1 Tax=Yeosuana sp. TaxID=2529388 RepID=UPI004054E54C|tara:strand:- start:177 stop:449 length:273 start_codon:yes stop_codon:yes gene_type:complete